MPKPKIHGPTPEKGDVYEETRGGRKTGRVVELTETDRTHANTKPYPDGSPGLNSRIKLDTIRPTKNGWRLIRRGGKAVKWNGYEVVEAES